MVNFEGLFGILNVFFYIIYQMNSKIVMLILRTLCRYN